MEPRISIITLGVSDMERAWRFYKEGLGLPTTAPSDAGIVFFKTSGACLALYPFDKLAEDIGSDYVDAAKEGKPKFPGITIAHNTREKAQVEELLARAEKAGGKIIKPAQDVFWGGYSGYFTDPDGYLWEVAWADCWKFHADGSLVIE
ncbi:MAG: VOC family protein [Candidatus Sumerlaeia bacterium]